MPKKLFVFLVKTVYL